VDSTLEVHRGLLLWSIRREAANAYDNSILYTDFILSKVIRMLEDHGGLATLTYTPDHGEDLLDDERNLFGHGAITEYSVEVPLLIWLSDAYRERFPAVEAALAGNRHARVSHDNVFFTLLDLARIRHRFTAASETLSNPAFEERDRYVLGSDMKVHLYRGGATAEARNR